MNIEDIGLLIPLARRWQDEIRRHATDQSNHTTSVPVLGESTIIPYAYTPQLHQRPVTLQHSTPLVLARPTTYPMPERPLVSMQHPPNLSRAHHRTNMALRSSHSNPFFMNYWHSLIELDVLSLVKNPL